MPTFVHWFQSYGEVFFHISWCAQWPHHLDWPWKTTPKGPLTCLNLSFVPKLWRGLLPCQLMCIVTSPLQLHLVEASWTIYRKIKNTSNTCGVMFNTVQITISTSSLQRSLGRRWFKYKCSWTKCSEITEKCDKKLQFLHCTVVMFMFKNKTIKKW